MTDDRPTVRIEYCTSCNYAKRALWLAGEVLEQLQHSIAGLELVCGDKGVFDVTVNDKTVFSKGATGRFPEPEELTFGIFNALEEQ